MLEGLCTEQIHSVHLRRICDEAHRKSLGLQNEGITRAHQQWNAQAYGSLDVFVTSSLNLSSCSAPMVLVFPNHLRLGSILAIPVISLFPDLSSDLKYPPTTFPSRSCFAFPIRYVFRSLILDLSLRPFLGAIRSGLSELLPDLLPLTLLGDMLDGCRMIKNVIKKRIKNLWKKK